MIFKKGFDPDRQLFNLYKHHRDNWQAKDRKKPDKQNDLFRIGCGEGKSKDQPIQKRLPHFE
jgi:hypothetical protein